MELKISFVLIGVFLVPLNVAFGRQAQGQQTYRLDSPIDGLELFLRRQAPAGAPRHTVLMVHGATFPSALATGFRFDGRSWMDELTEAGFDTWALDFLGYGESDRYPQMSLPPTAGTPLGRAPEAAQQIQRAIEFIRSRTSSDRVSMVAHSWGTMPASLLAAQRPDLVERLVLFGPIAPRNGELGEAEPFPAHHEVTEMDQRSRFLSEVPQGYPRVLLERHLVEWLLAYMSSDSLSYTREPHSVRVPFGPIADLLDLWSGNEFPYRLADIKAPTLIVRGEWDTASSDEDTRNIFSGLTATSTKRLSTIGRATHLMHLETGRHQLYRDVESFLAGPDVDSLVGGALDDGI